MRKIDCLGEICPVPTLKLQRELDNIKKGETLLFVTDHSCTLNSIEDFCQVHGLSADPYEVINGVWEITVTNK